MISSSSQARRACISCAGSRPSLPGSLDAWTASRQSRLCPGCRLLAARQRALGGLLHVQASRQRCGPAHGRIGAAWTGPLSAGWRPGRHQAALPAYPRVPVGPASWARTRGALDGLGKPGEGAGAVHPSDPSVGFTCRTCCSAGDQLAPQPAEAARGALRLPQATQAPTSGPAPAGATTLQAAGTETCGQQPCMSGCCLSDSTRLQSLQAGGCQALARTGWPQLGVAGQHR